MLSKIRNRQGFTLIELLIVVAIIGILAAVAIPQFSAYRQKGFNSSAASDIKNAKTTQESMFADFQTYGKTQAAGTLLTATNVAGQGVTLSGPLVTATATVAGALLDGPRPDPANNPPIAALPAGAGLSLSNGVQLRANSMPVNAQFISPSYMMIAKNIQGTRVFYTETEATNLLYTQNDVEAGTVLATSLAGAAHIADVPTAGIDLASGAASPNPAPYATWVPL